MNAFKYLPLAILLSFCSNRETVEVETVPAESITDPDCANLFSYGNRSLCMPLYEGYTESYADSAVAQRFKPLNDGNIVMAIYLKEDDREALRRDSAYVFDDYYKVWVFRKKCEYFANDAAITEAEVKWAEDLNRAPKIDLADVPASLPERTAVIVEQYRPDDYLTSSVHLVKMKTASGDMAYIVMYNTLALRTKLVFFNYYMEYDGPDAIKRAKKNNDAFGRVLLEANN